MGAVVGRARAGRVCPYARPAPAAPPAPPDLPKPATPKPNYDFCAFPRPQKHTERETPIETPPRPDERKF